jgi:O-acetylhomoserine (thiol)-lyase
MDKFWRFETTAVHGGYDPDEFPRAVAPPIYPSAAYAFDSTEQSVRLFDGLEEGYVYSRIANPGVVSLSMRVNALEGGVGGCSLASGQAAVACALQALVEQGDNFVSARSLYGTTFNAFAHVFARQGVEARLATYDRLDEFEAAIDGRTRAIYCETIANPSGHGADIEALAALAHAHGLPLIVDNTVPTPYLCRPIEFGADIVVHSLTKYMAGHGTVLGGAVVDAGRFDWAAATERFGFMSRPDPSHHNVSFTETYGEGAYIRRVASVPARNFGATLSPFNAFLIAQGIETLALRMDRICFNAELIARYLSEHPAVSWVNYGALPSHPDHAKVQKYMGGRASGIVTFGVQGGRAGGARFQDALRLVRRAVNIGDCKTLACHPASTTHRQLSPEELVVSGVSEDLVRISIGIEHVEDLVADIDQALRAAIA